MSERERPDLDQVRETLKEEAKEIEDSRADEDRTEDDSVESSYDD